MSDTIEPKLAPVSEDDIKKVGKLFKDNLETYVREHLDPEFELDKTMKVDACRSVVIDMIKKKLVGKQEAPAPKKDPVLIKRDLLLRRFDGKEKPLEEDIFDKNGNPKYLLSENNGMVWPAEPALLDRLGKGFAVCDREGNPVHMVKHGNSPK